MSPTSGVTRGLRSRRTTSPTSTTPSTSYPSGHGKEEEEEEGSWRSSPLTLSGYLVYLSICLVYRWGNGRKCGWFSPFLLACYDPETEELQSLCRYVRETGG